MNRIFLIAVCVVFFSCSKDQKSKDYSWEKHGKLVVEEGNSIITYEDGTPFLWLGCTAWGMPEWLNREDVDLYLDNRKQKGFNVVQFCLFWGKRQDYPTRFTCNPQNPYGHKALMDSINNYLPLTVEGGSPENPNDYWDHVDYILKAIKERNMYAAVLPIWGRRYINATQGKHAVQVFTKKNIKEYARFLGERYANEPNIIWVLGGDVKAEDGGDYKPEYRLLAEGLGKGVTGIDLKWNQPDQGWDQLFMTYHPDGAPLLNSSTWFHNDAWLDFNMIETFSYRDRICKAIRADLSKKPLKPTVLGEPQYEGILGKDTANSLNIRRQAWQTFFSGGTGFTYGGSFDNEGNGPLFSTSNNWKHLLELEGASQLKYLKSFLNGHSWSSWIPTPEYIIEGKGSGELEKLVVYANGQVIIYFPDNSKCIVNNSEKRFFYWLNPSNNDVTIKEKITSNQFQPPNNWEDAVLVLY